MLRRSTLPLALAVLAGSAGLSSAEDVRAAIEAANKSFCAAIARGDTAAVAALYTGAAQALPPGSEAVRGREGIQKAFQGMVDAGLTDLTLTTQEVEAHGDTAHEVGTWTLRGKDGSAVDNGRYIVIWKNEGGKWLLHRDIWNSSRSAAAH